MKFWSTITALTNQNHDHDQPAATKMNMFFPFPLPLTPKQWFYIAGTQCLVAGIIDGGANFGIAYAMYHGQDQVKMWVFSQVSPR
jgi:hypothetical protein